MAKFTEEELEQLNTVLPHYNRSMCKKALELVRDHMAYVTKEQFHDYQKAYLELLKVDASNFDIETITVQAEVAQPLSKFFATQGAPEAFCDSFLNIVPEDALLRTIDFENCELKDLKAFFAAGIFTSLICLSGKEKFLGGEDVSEAQKLETLDFYAEQVRTLYEMLLYLDSELHVINSNAARQKGTESKNQRFSSLHMEYFEYYEANRERWPSNDECARQFYKALPDEKKVYASTEHARRQLTEAHRKYKKSSTST